VVWDCLIVGSLLLLGFLIVGIFWYITYNPGLAQAVSCLTGLDDRAIGVRSPAEAKDFSSSLCVQTGSGAHPAFCPMGTGGSFPRG
jgi:hypothetical protein